MTDELAFPKQAPEPSHYVHELVESKLSMPWFVGSNAIEAGEKAFITRGGCEVRPLINGAETFGAVEEAIRSATQTIDYVTWGFDPAMRFTDGGQSIGDILLEKAQTVKVRLLVWYGGYLSSATLYAMSGDTGYTEKGQDHKTSNLPGYDEYPGEKSKYVSAAKWYQAIKKHPNIEFAKRAMDLADVDDAIRQNRHVDRPAIANESGMTIAATHHQKMVLIDYMQPDRAIGFVMGSNSLQRYWDTDDHFIHRDNRRMDYTETTYPRATDANGKVIGATTREVKTPKSVYLGPWQDVSARVRGQLLFDLHVNFSRAWARAGGTALESGRRALKPVAFQVKEGGEAQVVRTQPQEKDWTISDSYFQAVLNARQYIYFENQYFRLAELTRGIATAAESLSKAGRKESLYVFVVTNVPPDEHGRFNTYQMLSALGRGEQMPTMHNDASVKKRAEPPLAVTRGGDQPGLQTVVCTLTACENLNCQPIYTHSKLMIIDDVFYTLGSANLNKRSMVSDSEMNVAVPDRNMAKHLRTRLWDMHRGEQTKVKGRNFADEFTRWGDVATTNQKLFKDEKIPLNGRLTRLIDSNPAITRADD